MKSSMQQKHEQKITIEKQEINPCCRTRTSNLPGTANHISQTLI